MKKTRLTYFDMAKGLAILLVVLGHIADSSNGFIKWAYSFHVALFFIISGCLLKLTEKKEKKPKEQIISKFCSLLIPYFVFAIPQIIIEFMLSSYDVSNLLYNIKDTLSLVIYSALWFLPALFFAEVGFVYFNRITSTVNRVVVFVATFALLFMFSVDEMEGYPLLFSRAAIGLGFLIIGYYAFDLINSNKIKIYMAIPALIPTYILAQMNESIDLFSMEFGNIYIYLFNCIVASISIIVILKSIKINIKPLEFYGKNSLLVMATHEWLLGILSLFMEYRDLEFSMSLAIFAALMIIEVLVIFIINTCLSWPLGKKRKGFYNYICKISK